MVEQKREPRLRARMQRAILWTLSWFTLVLFMIAGWLRYNFGDVGFQAIIANLPIGGRTVGNAPLAIQGALICLVAPLLVMVAAAVLLRWRRSRTRTRISPATRQRRGRVILPVGAFTVSLAVLLSVAGVPNYATAMLTGSTFAPYYVPPQTTQTPGKPLNLITIHLESMENTFGQEEIFGENLLAPLDAGTQGFSRYEGLQQYPGGGWTMAGLVGTQCGLPLRGEVLVPGVHPNISGEQVDRYLPGATCLGDVLAEQGYTSTWMGGADSKFAGKGTFLHDHGYDRHLGLADWVAQGEDPANMSAWGLSDARLMERAADTVDELHAGDAPFHLSLLTLDTHEPAGLFPTCTTGDKVAMAAAVKCSTQAVAGFLSHLKKSGYLKDTVVVVMGDHLKGTSGASDFKTEMAQAKDRTILLRVWSPDGVRFNRERADQFSMLPTTLDLLHLAPPGGRAGLGVSLVGEHDLTDTAVALPADEYEALMTAPSTELYQQLWAGSHR